MYDTIGATIHFGEPMDLKKSQPESLGGKLCSAKHFAAAAAYRSSAFSFALVMSDKDKV